MGTGYKGNALRFTQISENITAAATRYPYSHGLFGQKGQGRNYTRNIYAVNPIRAAKNFYNLIAYGGIERKMANGNGSVTKMADGTYVSYRTRSYSDGTSVVEINIKGSKDSGGLKNQKIHFVEGKNEK